MIARSSIQRELRKYQKDDNLKFIIDTKENDLTDLRVELIPPDNTPYEDGVFFLTVSIPALYPSAPPNIEFETKIYHPNITKDGKICLNDLKSEWRSTYTLKHAINYIYFLLKNPDWEDPLNASVADEYKKNPKTFEKTAREWTKEYAK